MSAPAQPKPDGPDGCSGYGGDAISGVQPGPASVAGRQVTISAAAAFA